MATTCVSREPAHSSRLQRVALLAIGAATLWPLWRFKYLPGTDLPNHIGISSVLWNLMTGSAAPSTGWYALNIQPVPYHLGYMLLSPAVGLLGPFLGTKVALTFIALATLLSAGLLFRALSCPWWSLAASVFLIFGPTFFWGFLPTLVGIPFVLLGGWAFAMHLRTGRRRYVGLACTAGLLVSSSHVVLIVPFAAFAAAYVLARGWRRGWRVASLVMLAVALPLVPAMVGGLHLNGASDTGSSLEYGSLREFGDRLRMQFAIFDRGLGRASHLSFVVLVVLYLAVAAIEGRATAFDDSRRTVRRFALFAFACQVVAYAATPIAMRISDNHAWGINFRFFPFVEATLVGLAFGATSGWSRRLLASLSLILAGLHVFALLSFGKAFDETARDFDRILAAMRPGATLEVAAKPERFADAWAPVLTTMHGYHLATGGAFDSAIFAEKQTPIRSLRAPQGQATPPLSVGEYDYLLVQQLRADSTRHAPRDGRLVIEAGPWRLFERASAEGPGASATPGATASEQRRLPRVPSEPRVYSWSATLGPRPGKRPIRRLRVSASGRCGGLGEVLPAVLVSGFRRPASW